MKMSTIDEILASMPDDNVGATIDDVLVIDANTRQITLPSSEFVFGVESDTHSERKYFMCSRYVGNELDLASCFIRVNYRNANGETDIYLVDDVRVVGDNILFSWLLSKKVTIYRGQVQFVVCASRLGGNGSASVEWHTTVAKGTVLEGVEPNINGIIAETDDALAVLLTTVDAQRENVIKEGAVQVSAVQAAAKAAENASKSEIEAKGANTLASIPNDYTALGAAVNAIDRGAAPGIVCEVEGSSVFVSDASNKPMQNIRIFGKSTQDGVPSPENHVEIKSVENPVIMVCGKNLIPYPYTFGSRTMSGVTFTDNGDGSITANGTATGAISYYLASDFTLPRGQYIFSGCPSGGGLSTYRIYFSDNVTKTASDYGNTSAFTLENTLRGMVVLQVFSGAVIENLTFYPMIRSASVEDHVYEKYMGKTLKFTHTLPGIPVTSGGNYTDENGQQWICDEVDLARGVYVQRLLSVVFDGSDDEGWRRDYTSDENKRRMVTSSLSEKVKTVANNQVANLLCDMFMKARADDTYSLLERVSVDDLGRIHVYTNAYNDLVENWVSFLASNPMSVMCELATPVETPLSETEIAAYRALHTNKPNTTILNDAGAHMAVAYTADTKLYIDNLVRGK